MYMYVYTHTHSNDILYYCEGRESVKEMLRRAQES